MCELVERTGLMGDAARAHDSDLDQAPRTPLRKSLRTPLEVVKQDTEREMSYLDAFDEVYERYKDVFKRLA